jgi:hypothetical protein
MSRLTSQAMLSLILIGLLIPGWAAGPSIGIAIAPGSFQIDGAPVTGNATLFEGAAVETSQSSSRLQVNSGVRVDLSPESRATVHGKYVTLEKGFGELQSAQGYQMEARSLRVEPQDAKAVARVGFEGKNSVRVSAVNGPVRVFNHLGLVVADVIPGVAMSFTPQAGQDNASVLTGCLSMKEGKYVLTGDNGVVVELRGSDLEQNVGKKVEISGTAFRSAEPVPGASSVIRVNTVKATGESCTAAAANKPLPRPAKAGLSNGAKAAIAVVAVGGAAGGIVAATSGKSKSPN